MPPVQIFRIIIIIYFFSTVGFANEVINDQIISDSLEAELPKAEDTNKVFIYRKLFRLYYNSNPAKALEYAKKSLEISQNIGYDKGIGYAYDAIGNSFDNLGDYSKAVEYKYIALRHFEKINFKKGIGNVNNNLGVIYFRQGNYEKALGYYLKALDLAREIENEDMISTFLSNAGEVYFKMGNYAKAIEFQKTALEISKRLSIDDNIAYATGILGQTYSSLGSYQKAQDYLLQAIETFTRLGDIYAQSEYYIYLARNFEKQGMHSKAILHLNKAISLSNEIDAKEWKKEAYYTFSQIYAKQKDFKKAHQYTQMTILLKDSILNETGTQKIAQMHILHESEKKEEQIEQLTHEKQEQEQEIHKQQIIEYILGFGAFLFSILAILLLNINHKRKIAYSELHKRNEKVKQQKDEIESQAEELRITNDIIQNEKNKSEKLLLNILPESVANELKANGESTPRHFDATTVLFSDIVNFTQYAEQHTAAEIIEELDHLFEIFDEICERNKLEKIKTIGDCYMAVGGLPNINDSHAEDAVNAALEMLDAIRKTQWQLRIGIHTGPVIAGVIGKHKFAFDVWGDTVNIAARMESGSENNRINISSETYEIIKDRFECTKRGKILAKNKGEIEMYFVDKKYTMA